MKKNTFEINEITYTARDFDFDIICDLEDMGVQLNNINDKPTSTIRAYFALCAGKDKKYASTELQKHLMAGGNLDNIGEAMAKAMEESDFFQALNQNQETEDTTDEKTETEEEVNTQQKTN